METAKSSNLLFSLLWQFWMMSLSNLDTFSAMADITDRPKLSCNFSHSSCEWISLINEKDKNFLWEIKRHEGSEESGPSYDHTTLSRDGSYIGINTNDRKEGIKSTAILASPTITTTDETCLSFWYFMHGYDVGQLNVWKQIGSGDKTKIFSVFGPQGKRWYKATVSIGSGQNVTLKFEGTYEGKEGLGDIALDDISLTYWGSCHQKAIYQPDINCDFENDFCSWYPIGAWFRKVASSDSFGSHAYLWNRSWRYKQSQSAYLRGNSISVLGQGACFSFMYRVNSDFMETFALEAYQYGQHVNENGRELWFLRGISRTMTPAFVTIPPGENIYLAFYVNPRQGKNGVVSIDRIRLSHYGPCLEDKSVAQQRSLYACDFDTTLCDWFQRPLPSLGKWTRNKGPTTVDATGPTADHTSGDGYYMYLNASKVDIAQLYSPLVTIPSHGACLTFWYHMYGEDINELTVWRYQHLTFLEKERRYVLWNAHGNQGNDWIQLNVSIPQAGKYVAVVFEAKRGYFPRGDIAIDDVSLSLEGSCDQETFEPTKTTLTTSPVTTTTTTRSTTSLSTTGTSGEDRSNLMATPEIKVKGEINPAFVGSRVQLECGDYDGSYGMVEWIYEKNGQFGRNYYIITSDRITFEEISEEDENTFKCRIYSPLSDGFSDFSKPVHITVVQDYRPKPKLVSYDVIEPAIIGSTITLTCGEEMNDVEYIWTVTDFNYVTENLGVQGRELVLKNISMRDNGRYYCSMAKDGFHTGLSDPLLLDAVQGKPCVDTNDCQGGGYNGICRNHRCQCEYNDLLVDTKCLERPPRPQIEIQPTYYEFANGESFFLRCKTTEPVAVSAVYVFKRDGNLLPQLPGTDKFYIYPVGPVTLEDSGAYSCSIYYGEISSLSSSNELEITVKDSINLDCDFDYLSKICNWMHEGDLQRFVHRYETAPDVEANHLDVLEGFSISSSAFQGASLRSPLIEEIEYTACLSFKYRMDNTGSISLSVWIIAQSSLEELVKGINVWETVGYQGDGWKIMSVEISPRKDFYIKIQAQGRISIDEISFSYHGICKTS